MTLAFWVFGFLCGITAAHVGWVTLMRWEKMRHEKEVFERLFELERRRSTAPGKEQRN